MKAYIGISLLLGLMIIGIGCSSGPTDGLTSPMNDIANTPTSQAEGHIALGVFTFSLDPATGDVAIIHNREVEKHYDVTGYILPPACDDCIGIHFQGIQPGSDVHIIKVNLRNPSAYTVYDVRGIILWDDTDNRRLVNYEAMTDIFDDGGTVYMNPFITFRDLVDPTNAFVPGQIVSKNFFIDFPKPRNYKVTFIIEGSFPGNSKDPWNISSETTSNPLDESGDIEATISCRVADHQGDVNSVTVDLTKLGFPGTVPMTFVSGDKWELKIKNDYSASMGTYYCLIEASDATNKWPLWDYVEIEVAKNLPPYVYVDSEYTGGMPDGTEEHPYTSINTGMANSQPGQIVMVKQGTYVENVELIDGRYIRGYGTQKPVIKGLGDALVYAGQFVGSAVVENFILQGNGLTIDYAIHCVNATGLEFYDIDFVSTGATKSFTHVIKLENTHGFKLADGRLQNLKVSSGAPILWYFDGSDNIIIESTLVKGINISSPSHFPAGTGAIIYMNNCDDVTIKQNIIAQVEGDIGNFDALDFAAVRANGGSNIALRNDLFYSLKPTGDCNLALSAITTNGSDDFTMEHLTIDNIGDGTQNKGKAYAINALYGPGVLMNNILTNVIAPVSGDGYGFNSNQSNTQSYSDVWTTGKDDTYRYNGLASEGVGGLNANPEYINPGSGNYHLQPTSPCLTTGMGGTQMGAYGGANPLDL